MYGSWMCKHDKLHVKDNRILRPIFPIEFSYRVLQRYNPTGFFRVTWVTGSTIAVREESPGATSTEIAKGTQIIPSKPYANTRYLRNTAKADEVHESPLFKHPPSVAAASGWTPWFAIVAVSIRQDSDSDTLLSSHSTQYSRRVSLCRTVHT